MDKDIKESILSNISLTGAADAKQGEIQPLVNTNIGLIIDRATGLPKIKPHIKKQFKLMLAKPKEIGEIPSLEIRCALCHRVISYPAWYYVARFVVNQFHYFICFDSNHPGEVTTNCFRSR